MNLKFNIQKIETTEFGICSPTASDNKFVSVPVSREVKGILHEMVEATHDAMEQNEPAQYEPSEKYGATEYLYLPTNDEFCKDLIDLHDAANLPTDVSAIKEPGNISAYFVRLTNDKNERLTAVRQARQFKGDLKKKLISLIDDALDIVSSPVFRLDSDFDVIIDDDHVHIWRPRAFESLFNLNDAIIAAASKNIEIIGEKLPFIDFDSIQVYSSNHPRAARYLASIKSQNLNIDHTLLKSYCRENGVQLSRSDGKLIVDQKNIMPFLEVLDRRRYNIKLAENSPEQFVASSRRKIDK